MSVEGPAGDGSARFAYEGLERAFHEKARLGILTSLLAHPGGLVFAELKELCALTDGNLSRHLAVLEEAGLVEIRKGSRGKRPQTRVRLTDPGRMRFLEYIEILEQVVSDAAEASQQERRSTKRIGQGWSPA